MWYGVINLHELKLLSQITSHEIAHRNEIMSHDTAKYPNWDNHM